MKSTKGIQSCSDIKLPRTQEQFSRDTEHNTHKKKTLLEKKKEKRKKTAKG